MNIKSGNNVNKNNPTFVVEKPFKATGNFTRPADTTAYAIGDAISNSTSSPTVTTLDLSSYAKAGDSVYITNAKISVSSKLANSTINIWVSPTTFTHTNDNSELAIDDTTVRDSIICICQNVFTTANNTKVESDNGVGIIKLSTTDLFVALQASSAFTPASQDRFDITVEGVVLR